MKDILLSIRPKWCEKICHEIGKDGNGKSIYEKTIEVRKSAPKEVPFKAFIYCTKDRKNLLPIEHGKVLKKVNFWKNIDAYYGFGKVIGEFVCDKVVEIEVFNNGAIENYWLYHLDESCLSFDELGAYIGKGNIGYGWHISNLKIYDKPRELKEFNRPCISPTRDCEDCIKGKTPYTWDFDESTGKICCTRRLSKVPQSWCYVEEEK